jgi:hypothetical protein
MAVFIECARGLMWIGMPQIAPMRSDCFATKEACLGRGKRCSSAAASKLAAVGHSPDQESRAAASKSRSAVVLIVGSRL